MTNVPMQSPTSPPPPGHNNPPTTADVLRDKYGEIIARHDELLAGADRIPQQCDDDDTAGKLGDLIKMITACTKAMDAHRVSEKEPYLTEGRNVDGFFKKFTEALDKAKTKVNGPLANYLRRKEDERRRKAIEDERASRAEAQRLADEAAAQEAAQMPEAAAQTFAAAAATEKDAEKAGKLAEAKPADLSRTRGDYGSVASLRTRWVAENLDFATLDLDALRPHISRAELEKAANAWARINKSNTLRGAHIREVDEAAVR